jgi:predicted RND superfamily exporter protein
VGFKDAYGRFVTWVCARPRQAAAFLILLCLPALALTAKFFSHVEAGLQELLPRDAPTVRALDRIHARLGSQSHLTVIARSPDPATNRRFMDALAARLRARNIPEAKSVQGDVRAERAWLRGRAPLLLPAAKFDDLIGQVEEAVRASKAKANPLFVSVSDANETLDQKWAAVRQRAQQETRAYDRFPNGYLETRDGEMVVMLVRLVGSEVDMGPSTRLLDAVKAEVAALRAQFPASLQVAYTGDVPNLIEEHDAILSDLSVSSVLVFLLVALLIIGYFRSPRSVLVVLIGVVPGLLFTFAIGNILVGHLNSNTAFLGSIIAGNGINYPLLFLAYFRARSPSEPLAESITRAARHALPGTLGAAATASAAYAGLASSNFRGFSQFGWLGGAGMLTTWLLTFVAVPVAIALWRPPRLGERPTKGQRRLLVQFSRRSTPQVLAGVFVVGALLIAAIGIGRGVQGGVYEMRLQALRNRTSLKSGSASWEPKMTALFGSWINPVVVLVDRPEDRERAAAELRRTLMTEGQPLVDRIDTIEQFRPPLAEQQRRLERLRKLARAVHALPTDAIPEDARPFVDEWLAPARLDPITTAEIPDILLQGFHELDGTVDRSVLIYPAIAIDYEDGVNMQVLARALAESHLPDGAVAGGAFLFMADVFRLVHQEVPRVVIVVCLLVAGVLVPIFLARRRRIALVIGTIAPVAVAAQAIMLALGVKVNMLNFAAVPITIGVGADYAVNLLGAMDTLRLDARRACARMGSAILLCSMTTIVGYASLLLAQSGALRTFGWAAVLGEVMAVVTVLLVLPAVMPAQQPSEDPQAADKDLVSAGARALTRDRGSQEAPPPSWN